jgi:hypothetical protein
VKPIYQPPFQRDMTKLEGRIDPDSNMQATVKVLNKKEKAPKRPDAFET